MKVALLADFGSTYTKVVAVDLAEGALAGTAQAATSLDGDVLDGYQDAADAAVHEARGRSPGATVEVAAELAASSAGGGMRMAAVGLVDSLTAAAASMAALNAGARLAGTFAGTLTDADAERLAALDPEIVLFAGGTDGGQRTLVRDNAKVIAPATGSAHVVVACNADVANEVGAAFLPYARSVTIVPNVLPDIGVTSFDGARDAISAVFIGEVIAGKRLSSSLRFLQMVRMATPDAVFRAAVLYARTRQDAGDGVVVTDVGGATTDVYSVLQRKPVSGFGTARKGFVSSAELRTVQGDLGLRSNARGVLEADGAWLAGQRLPGQPEMTGAELAAACQRRSDQPDAIFDEGAERVLDERLTVSCLFRALERHCGQRAVRTGVGGRPALVEQGPNLTGCRALVAGGGIMRAAAGQQAVAAATPAGLVRQAIARLPEHVLAPRQCQVVVDRRYVLAAAGLLASAQPQIAESLLRRELVEEPADD